MNALPMVLSREETAAIADLCRFAQAPGNWLMPLTGRWFIPGLRPEYTRQIRVYKCVFTWTAGDDDVVLRQLSVSVLPPEHYREHRQAIYALALEFGLTGFDPKAEAFAARVTAPADWHVTDGAYSLGVAQRVSAADVAAARAQVYEAKLTEQASE